MQLSKKMHILNISMSTSENNEIIRELAKFEIIRAFV